MSEKLTIKQICKQYNLSPVYVRRMILKEVLPSEFETVPGTTIQRHVVDVEVLEAWRNSTRPAGKKREDGRNKYTMYATPAEIEIVLKLLEGTGVIITRTNPSKVVEDES